MKAISLWQPWASAIVQGYKKIETRSWSTRYRGPLLIHAAKSFPKVAQDFAAEQLAYGRGLDRLPRGAIIGVCNLVSVEHTHILSLSISALERLYGDYSPGRYGWELASARAFVEPIGYRGAQGLFEVPHSVIAEALRPPVCDLCGNEYKPSGYGLKGICSSCDTSLGGGSYSAKIVRDEAKDMRRARA